MELAFEVGQTAYVEPDAKVGKIIPIEIEAIRISINGVDYIPKRMPENWRGSAFSENQLTTKAKAAGYAKEYLIKKIEELNAIERETD